MTMFMSKKGEVHTKEHWEQLLENFWVVFESSNDPSIAHRLPQRPNDAWERFSNVLGLTEVK